MSIRKIPGFASSYSEGELLAALSSLAIQPAGDIFIFDFAPETSQIDRKNKIKCEQYELKKTALTLDIKTQLSHSIANLTAASRADRPYIAMKVLFVLGIQEREKDLDNMLKWFMDCFKKAISDKTGNLDDSLISDLRALKIRITTSSGSGFIGISIKTGISPERMGDLEFAQFLCMKKCRGNPPQEIKECLTHVESAREDLQALFQNIRL